MAQYKIAGTPLLTHWSCCSLSPSHRYNGYVMRQCHRNNRIPMYTQTFTCNYQCIFRNTLYESQVFYSYELQSKHYPCTESTTVIDFHEKGYQIDGLVLDCSNSIEISLSFQCGRMVYNANVVVTLQWRHNEQDNVSNHQPHDSLLNRWFRHRSKKTPKLRVTGLCARNSPGTGEFPAQMASNAENVSIWWHHHVEMPLHITFQRSQ